MSRLAIHGGRPVIDARSAKFEWPIICDGIRRVVEEQLQTSLSIRDRSGVFRDFEEQFSRYHGRRHAVLSNSGTSAILSMFEGINLAPGDQVIAPGFSFHASASPAVYLGAQVIFADIDEQGGISADAVIHLLSDRTRAVVVTHLWGLPARDVLRITSECRERGVYVFEDCSHAHGASLNNVRVGSIGDAAAWSLQGQKVVSGGEGGIMLTDDDGIFARAILHGHYNRRTRDEIPRSSDLWRYFETGLGLKLRAHPLAIAIALEQFGHLGEFLLQKNVFARYLMDAIHDYDFLRLPFVDDMTPSWYAFPLLFDGDALDGVTRESFVRALRAEGLVEVDIPSATNVLADLPLFRFPREVLGRRYSFDAPSRDLDGLTNAREYARKLIKLPIWAYQKDQRIMQGYVDGFRKVADYVEQNGSL